ncbi:MAG: hypothetical protein LBK23_10600 [Oscillospiraceae bacterium]|jgi:hypothetical protein|nr:hypothetical protein [Oscillospiraceae bacterium]
MATTTFDKEIVLSKEGAKRLVKALREPPSEIPDMSEFIRHSEEAWRCYLNNYRKSSKTDKKQS